MTTCLLAIDLNGDVKALAHRLSLPATAADAFAGLRRGRSSIGSTPTSPATSPRSTRSPCARRARPSSAVSGRRCGQFRAGTTSSYRDLAVRIGSPSAVRAVGAANGANPIPIVVPCHRVIGTDGALVGYGGGLDRKRWLLAHEGIIAARLWD